MFMNDDETVAGTTYLKDFWEKGLRFQCKPGCRNCCEIPGMVFVLETELEPIARFLKKKPSEFKRKNVKRYWDNVYYLNYPDDQPCMFLTDEGCAIYPVRPVQCSSFPFWPENLSDPKIWRGLKSYCPGINKGPLRTSKDILDILTGVDQGLEL